MVMGPTAAGAQQILPFLCNSAELHSCLYHSPCQLVHPEPFVLRQIKVDTCLKY